MIKVTFTNIQRLGACSACAFSINLVDRFYPDLVQYIPELNVLDCLFREDWFKAVLGIKEVRRRVPGDGSANSFDEGKLNYWQLYWQYKMQIETRFLSLS